MNRQEYMEFHAGACQRMIDITKKKNADYAGSGGDAFANFRQIGALVQSPSIIEVGFLTRMSDKMSRIGSFVSNGTLMVKEESVEDTLLDLANYCILFAGYLRSEKQKAELDKVFESAQSPKEFKTVHVPDYKVEEHREVQRAIQQPNKPNGFA